MTTLRTKLIRLAHENREARPHILPLLKKTARFKNPDDLANSLDAMHDSLLDLMREVDSLMGSASRYGVAYSALDEIRKSILSTSSTVGEYERKFRSRDFSGPF